MSIPAIIWRNPRDVQQKRLWNQARRNGTCSVYIVVRSGFGEQAEWEGLPNLEVLDGGDGSHKSAAKNRRADSRD